MSSLLVIAIENAAQDIDRIRNDVLSIDTTKLVISAAARDQSARITSSSYIWLSALLEQYFKSVLQSLFSEINNSMITYDKLKPCLFSSVSSTNLNSLKQLNDHKKIWPRRIDIFEQLWNSSNVILDHNDIPYDGKTIRPEHIEIMWAVFGISGVNIPSPIHRLSLTDVADGRNKLAHGEVNPVQFGRNKNPTDVLRTITHIEDIIMHIASASNDYLLNREYIR